MLKKTAGIALAASVLALPMLIASPASAATLPEGDTLYALSCDWEGEVNYSDLYRVDAETADLTYLSSSDLQPDCAGPAAYDPTTGKSYYIPLVGDGGWLATIDVATGAVTVQAFSGDLVDEPHAFAIDAEGQGWLISSDGLYRIDLDTAETTFELNLAEDWFYLFALDPSDGELYAVQYDTSIAYHLSTSDGVLTPIGTIQFESDSYSMQIDTSGRWWFQLEYGETSDNSLWSSPRPDGETVLEYDGDLYDSADEINPHIDSLLLTYSDVPPPPTPPAPGPQLAATGTDAAPLVAGGVALALVGGAIVLSAKRRRSA